MPFIADFHIHTKYSRATSPDMDLEHLSKWAKIKGIDVIGTGDFTHPLWIKELKQKLKSLGNGLFEFDGTKFILTVEIAGIYKQGGEVRKIHNLLIVPSFETADKIIAQLSKIGNLHSDGRPILGLSAKKLLEIVLEIDKTAMVIPCHAWTPWFSIFGSKSGFDSLEECFEEYTKYVFAIETGLSSDPAMNWRLSQLDNIALISNSDAHSPAKLGREANVFDCDMDYKSIRNALKTKDPSKFLRTIEFFPEEGKYHFDGHRDCDILWDPKQTKKHNKICPVCKTEVTVGVLHRVDDLADRDNGFKPKNAIPYLSIIPLVELIAEAFGKRPAAKAVQIEYDKIISLLGPEFSILLDVPFEKIQSAAEPKVFEAIKRMRAGQVNIRPGYDGVFGQIKIF